MSAAEPTRVEHPPQEAPPMPVTLAELNREELEALCAMQARELRNRSGALQFTCLACETVNALTLDMPAVRRG